MTSRFCTKGGRSDSPVGDITFLHHRVGPRGSRFCLLVIHGFKIVKEVSWFLIGLQGFQGSFMVFHGFWLVSMVFQGSFMVFHDFWLVSMVFEKSFMVYHCFWLVSMAFQGSSMVFHDYNEVKNGNMMSLEIQILSNV